jgi:hypothetical protein
LLQLSFQLTVSELAVASERLGETPFMQLEVAGSNSVVKTAPEVSPVATTW